MLEPIKADTGGDDTAAVGETLPAKPLNQNETLDAVAALMRGGEPDLDADHSSDDGNAAEPANKAKEPPPKQAPVAKPKTLQDAAKTLGMEPEAIYGLEIKTADGETTTLGALKDAFQGRAEASRASIARELQIDQRETAVNQEVQLWAQAGEEIAKAISPDVRKELVKQSIARQTREWDALLLDMPELADDTKRRDFDASASKLLSERYGVKASATRRIEVLVLRDLMRAEARLAEIMAFEPKAKQPARRSDLPQGRGGGAGSNITRADSRQAQTDAVAKLLKG